MNSSSTPFLSRPDNDDGLEEMYDDGEKLLSTHQVRSQRGYLSGTLQIVICMLAAWGIVALFLETKRTNLLNAHHTPSQKAFQGLDVYHPDTLPSGLNLCDCGSSIPEALDRGCVYDTLATAWMPPYCRDDELTAQFDQAGPGPNGEWSYFADEEGTVPLTVADVAALGGTQTKFWASRRWHIVHCLFYWQKYWRMRETRAIMEERFDTLAHVQHCARLILNPVPDHRVLIEVPVMMNGSIKASSAHAKVDGGPMI